MQPRAESFEVHFRNFDDVRLLRDAAELVKIEDDVVAGPIVREHNAVAVHDLASRRRDADAAKRLRLLAAVVPATVKNLNAKKIDDEEEQSKGNDTGNDREPRVVVSEWRGDDHDVLVRYRV